MAQLDRLLSVMVSNRADALLLDEGDMAKLDLGGHPRPVTKVALTAPQVVGLLKEVAPPDASRQLDSGQATTFPYVSTEGTFVVTAAPRSGKWHARVELDRRPELQRRPSVQFSVASIAGLEPTSLSSAPPAASPPPPPPPPAAAPAAAPAPAPAAHAPAGPAPSGGPAVAAAPSAARPADGPPAPAARRTSSAVTLTAAETAAAVGAAQDAINPFEGSVAARAELERLLTTLVEQGGSDLHLRCGEPPILRLHGEMHRLADQPTLENERLARMLKSIMPERNRMEFAETNDTDFAHEIPGCARFRANAARDRKGVTAVFRQIPANVVTVEQMNITPEVQKLCYLTKGLVLVTGPTGSGKSTTLCSLIDLVNRVRNDHVITIEDPIEFVHENKNCIITQRQVGVHTKSFKSALRAALREDPDIILVGELRDLETVSIAIETAETGHLVFGTLHTTTAAGTIDRIIDQFPADRQEQIRVMLAESLKGVISQTLCRKIGGGRVAAREILLSIPSVTNLIREGKTFQIPSVMQTSRRLGMVTLNDALIEIVDANLVEPKEAWMKAVDKMSFVQMLKQRGHDTSFAETEEKEKPAAKPAAKPDPRQALNIKH